MPRLPSVRRLTDPRSTEFGVVSSVVVGALSLVDPNALTPGRRLVYRIGVAGLTAAMTWVSSRAETPTLEARVGATVGAAGVAMGLAEAGEALDGRLQTGLVRAGVRHPRAVLAAAAAAFAAATFVADRAVSERYGQDDEAAEWEDRALSDTVRVLTSALLSRTDSFGAPALRTQLATAQERAFTDERLAMPATVFFTVADDAPLAVPGNAVFPVTARFATDDGTLYLVTLSVADGRLSSLEIVEVPEEGEEPVREPERWPEADEVTLHVETPNGTVPLG